MFDFARSGGIAQVESYDHKLKSALVDIAILSLMPLMSKASAMLHCRHSDHTPGGLSRVVSVPAIVCEGSDYLFTQLVAVVVLFVAGLALPVWITWQLYVRVDAPTVSTQYTHPAHSRSTWLTL